MNLKLGLIGAGRISPFHINAARKAGFNIISICATPNSANAKKIADEFQIPRVLSSTDEMFRESIDVLTIATSTHAQVDILDKMAKLDVPILVEKPVATHPNLIQKIIDKYPDNRILVALNRRHFGSVNRIREIVSELENPSFSVDIPEFTWDLNPNIETAKEFFIDNSIHVFDLITYIFGKVNEFEYLPKNKENLRNISVLVKTEKAVTGTLNISFSSSANISIKVFGKGIYCSLEPLELLTVFSGMKTIPASKEINYKRYFPIEIEKVQPKAFNESNKLGFLGLYRDLYNLCLGQELKNLRSAKLIDVFEGISISHQIMY